MNFLTLLAKDILKLAPVLIWVIILYKLNVGNHPAIITTNQTLIAVSYLIKIFKKLWSRFDRMQSVLFSTEITQFVYLMISNPKFMAY